MVKHDFDSGTLYHGDCLEIMPTIDIKVDMILADLPYGTTACHWDSVIPFEPLWENYKRLIKDNGAIVLTASQPFTSALVMSNIKMFKYEWIWEKPQGVDPLLVKLRPLNNIENILLFSDGKVIYNPQMKRGEPYKIIRDKNGRTNKITNTKFSETITVNNGERFPTRILKFNQNRGIHPTQKPVALFEYLIRTYTNPGDTVLDNTIGSGTTAVACYNTGRKWIGIEKDETIYKQAVDRIKRDTAQLKLFD